MPQQLSLAVVGAQHANADKRAPTRRFAIDLCRPGDPVELRPEPKNPKDEYAVAVHNREGMQMGYITAERAPWIGGMIRNRREITCIFQESTQHGAVIRVGFDGTLPVLPAPRERAESLDEDRFWPDPTYDD